MRLRAGPPAHAGRQVPLTVGATAPCMRAHVRAAPKAPARARPAGTVIPPGAEPSRNIMLGVVTMAGVLPVALFVRSAQLLSAVNSVSMVFLLFFCCIIALLPFAPTVSTGGRAGQGRGGITGRLSAAAATVDYWMLHCVSSVRHPERCNSPA